MSSALITTLQPPPFSPLDIPNLKLWLRADTIGLADGTAVTDWLDSSGNAAHFSQTGGNRPLYKTGIQNGKPVVRFDGSNDYVLGNAAARAISNNVAALTIYMVMQTTKPGSEKNPLYIGTNSGGSRATITREVSAGKFGVKGRRLDADTIQTKSGGSFSAGEWGIDVAVFDFASAKVYYYRNNTLVIDGETFQTDGNTSATDSSLFYIGSGNGAAYINGDIASVLVYTGVHGANEITRLSQHYSQQYGISI